MQIVYNLEQASFVEENGRVSTFVVTVSPMNSGSGVQGVNVQSGGTSQSETNGTPVFSAFTGFVEIVDILVKVGTNVTKGQVVAAVEALKTKHDIKAPCNGVVADILVNIGDEIDDSRPILTISSGD